MYIKNLQCEILRDASKDSPVVSFIASTANADRYGDVINQGGWDLSKYKQNPVILLNHNANSLPIGKGEVEVVDGKLMVDVKFDMDDPQAAEVARKTKAGFLNAVSVEQYRNSVSVVAHSEQNIKRAVNASAVPR